MTPWLAGNLRWLPGGQVEVEQLAIGGLRVQSANCDYGRKTISESATLKESRTIIIFDDSD